MAAYSTRARAGAPVSAFTVGNLRERLEEAGHDPWEGYASTRQRLTASLLAALGVAELPGRGKT